MHLLINFGLHIEKRQVSWWKPLEDFPKLIKFNGKCWEWLMYDKNPDQSHDYKLVFSEISPLNPAYHQKMVSYEDLFDFGVKCQCGAAFTSFPSVHMFYCPSYTKP